MTGKFNYDLLDKGDISALEESGLIDLIFEHDQEGMYLGSVVGGAPVHVLNWVLSYNIPKEILNKLDDDGFSHLNNAVYR